MTARAARLSVVPATLGLAGLAWIIAVPQMRGMGMGATSELGSLPFFVAVWAAMMAAMMLPGALPALLEAAEVNGGAHVVLFAASYLAVWSAVGLPVYALYRPHSAAIAGALTIAAGAYELTPLKQECRRRCQLSLRSGFQLGLYCVASSLGLMVVLMALGVMSIAWMAVITLVVIAQKLLRPKTSIDVPLALGLVALGVLAIEAPSTFALT